MELNNVPSVGAHVESNIVPTVIALSADTVDVDVGDLPAVASSRATDTVAISGRLADVRASLTVRDVFDEEALRDMRNLQGDAPASSIGAE